MNKNQIDQLLQKFYDGETSPEEEQMLRTALNDDGIDSLLLKGLDEVRHETPAVPADLEQSLSDSIDRWQEEEKREKAIPATWRRRAFWTAIAACVAAIVCLGWWFSHGETQFGHQVPVIADNSDKSNVAPSTNDEDAVIVVDEVSEESWNPVTRDAKSVKSVKRHKAVHHAQADVKADIEPEISEADEEEALMALVKFSTVINKGFNQLDEASETIEDVNHMINQHLTIN